MRKSESALLPVSLSPHGIEDSPLGRRRLGDYPYPLLSFPSIFNESLLEKTESSPPYDLEWPFKRFFDISVSILFLVVLFFPLIFIAVAIKLSSDGPIFFKQDRAGRGGKKFTLFKFRTMIDGADRMRSTLVELSDADGPLFKMKKDPRVTPLGRILRKSSLDEIPQLINVLKGEMSLVGPRPHLLVEVQNYRPVHRQRLNVKPGMTGIWQVSGRSALSFERGMDLDLAYVRTLSWKLDMWILLRTVPAVIIGKGAM